MTQDANQRAKNTGSDEWLFTKYDAFGRVTYTGKATGAEGLTRQQVQSDVDGFSGDLWVLRGGLLNVGSVDMYYNNGAYPHNFSQFNPLVTLSEVLTINYYDDYIDLPTGTPASVTLLGSPTNEVNSTKVKGLATVSKVKVLDVTGSNVWINTLTYFDTKARPVYTYSENTYLGTVDIVETQLDFIGKPLKSRTSHTKNSTTIVTLDNFTYDHVGRLVAQTQCIGDETLGEVCPGGSSAPINPVYNEPVTSTRTDIATTSITLGVGFHVIATSGLSYTAKVDPNITTIGGDQELIALNIYDELGQLESKNVGGDPHTTDVKLSAGLQQVDYTYNVRGWLTAINDINSTDKLFNFSIGYNQGSNPLYNGNISQTQWRTANSDDALKTYDYAYDPLNRIIAATDNTDNYNVSNIGYDKNGNIQSLTRNGYQNSSTFIDMDVLDYDYDNGNKLTKVTDGGNDAHGFKDGTNTNDDFEYDGNGNLKLDRNKGITAITYNHMSLPEQVSFGAQNIQYVYGADGTKLKRTSSTGTETLYAGNHIYEGSVGNAQLQY